MSFAHLTHDTLHYPQSSPVFDTTYIKTESQGEGPFLFYFQANYDASYEGTLGIGLYKYDKERLAFEEVKLMDVGEQNSWMVAMIEEGTYVVQIQSLTNTVDKYLGPLYFR